ncbi:uncharacterized protein LOC115231014, partial [Octopus sinensis]|uniref:Uncharacterized protein LOC115231014 n=1 Tax=Octopus sinensis TaxID=2607531 RepID=A0A6P7U631_9MOLL
VSYVLKFIILLFSIPDGDCVSLAIRRRCRNELGPKSAHTDLVRRCEISFIPTVERTVFHERRSHANSKEAQLYCYTDIPGFSASCPRFLPDKETSGLTCDPLKINTKRCDLTTSLGQKRRHLTTSRCRPMEICDWAVLLSGGWNRFALKMEHKTNLRSIYNMLRRNGFHSRNIEVFYANGSPDLIPEKTEKGHIVYPSVMKLALRNYIRNLCSTAKCVDSLVFYMNSPTKADGTALLWDINGNGMAEENERYKLGELKKDLKHCSAESVFLIVDQSHAGHIADAFRDSGDHPNVQVLASSQATEYSFGRNFTDFIASYNHTHTCLPQVLEESKKVIIGSTPEFTEGKQSETEEQRIPKNIFGAPCNLALPFRSWELDSYRGCRNVPTSVWLKILRESSQFLDN